MTSLAKGGNAGVAASAPTVAVRWRAGDRLSEIDVSAFLLRSSGKVAGDGDMVFYGQPASPDGSLRLVSSAAAAAGGLKETRFAAQLSRLDPGVERIAFTATIDDGVRQRLSFSLLPSLEILVLDGETPALSFAVPVTGATEVALILGELYRRSGQWKFRAVGQGFNGGLKPLAESFGVAISDAPEPAPAPQKTSVPPSPRPPAAPPAPAPPAAKPVNLAKVTLSKSKPSIDLAKKAEGYGEEKVNLNWNRAMQGAAPRAGLFGRKPKGIDLDLGCLYERADGYKGVVQALGDAFGSFSSHPYIELSGDDRTGAVADGEWLRVNGRHWAEIKRILIYAFIYEGVPNWAATDGVVSVYVPGSPPIEVRLEEGDPRSGMCAVALLQNVGGQMRVSREVRYFNGHSTMDRAYRWGMRWTAGSKD